MQDHRRHAVKMGLGNMIDNFRVGHFAKAFIVNDDVVALGPVFVAIDIHHMAFDHLARLRRTAAFLHNGPDDVGPLADAFGQDFFLRDVIVAATASQQ